MILYAFRICEKWDFDKKCIPFFFAGLFNLTRSDGKMNICKELDLEMFESYNSFVAPAQTQCRTFCETFTYKGSMQEVIPESAPIEVCYWIGVSDVTVSEEYLIYDLKVIVGSVGGITSLFLGFLWNTILRKIFGAVKASIRK